MYAIAGIFAAIALLLFGLIARERVERADQERIAEETQRRRLEDNARFLAEVTRLLLAGSLNYEQILARLAQLTVPRLGDWCSVDVRADDGSIGNVVVAHAEPDKARLARELQERYPPDPNAPFGAANVLRTGESELWVQIPDELAQSAAQDAKHLRLIQELGIRSAIVVPLKARGWTLGALTLVTGGDRPAYGEDDLAFAEEVARRAALLIDNARLHAAEQAARAEAEGAAERTMRLQELTAHLSAAATPTEVAEILVGESRYVLGARAGWVSVLNRDGTYLELLAASGYRADFVEKYRRMPMTEELSTVAVVREGRPRWIEGNEQLPEQYPELEEAYEATGGQALALVPLTSARRVFGFVALRFPGPRKFPTEERRLLLTLAGQCAQALERAQLFERELQARDVAERSRLQLQFLSEATATLTSTLDPAEMLHELLGLAVPRLADVAIVYMLEDSQGVKRLASVHVDPQKNRLFDELGDGPYDLVRHGNAPFVRALESKEPLVLTRIGVEDLEAIARDNAELGVLEALGIRSAQFIPLVVRGEAIGVLALGWVSERSFDEEELAQAREFSNRAGLALANARVYDAERTARERAEQASKRLRTLHRITAALAQAVTAADAARVIVEEGAAALGADAAAVQLLSDDGEELELVAGSGHLEELLEAYGNVGIGQELPAVEAVRQGDPLWFESAEELAARYPDHARVRHGLEALGLVPLVGRSGPLGLLTVSFEHERSLNEEDHSLVAMISRQCGQAVERAQLYEREQEARREAEAVSKRLSQLQAIVEVGLTARSVDQLLEELLVLVRDLLGADRATMLLIDDERSDLYVRTAVGLEEQTKADVRVPLGSGIAGKIASSGKPRIVEDVSKADAQSAYLREAGGSLIGVPVHVEDRVLGVLKVSSNRTGAFSQDDLDLLGLAAERASLALEQTSLYEREHEIATTLQQSMLPEELPQLENLQLAVRYLPGGHGVDVGGDWYDVIPLKGNRVGVVVGDVVGKGVLAAATMAQLRNALRVYALEGLRPSSVLTRMNELARAAGTAFATVLYVVLDLERRLCRYASAGHPPPLLLRNGWPAVFLEGGRSTPLGVGYETSFRQATAELKTGDVILLYTDGLVETRTSPLEEGMNKLREAVENAPEGLEDLLDFVGHELSLGARQDDVAIVALRPVEVPAEGLRFRLPAEPQSLAEMRRKLREWLEGNGVSAEQAQDVVVSCSEACANAIEHPLRPTEASFEVGATLRDGEVLLVVRDFGHWKEPGPNVERGLGLLLIENLMDGVEVLPREDGTEIRMHRRVESSAGARSVPR